MMWMWEQKPEFSAGTCREGSKIAMGVEVVLMMESELNSASYSLKRRKIRTRHFSFLSWALERGPMHTHAVVASSD